MIAIGVMLGFAAAFLTDASNTNRAYDALLTHRVALSGHELGCAWVASDRTSQAPTVQLCRFASTYHDHFLSWVVGAGVPHVLYVDPNDTAVHMTQATFNNGPVETTGDIVIGALLVAGATYVAVLHELHRRHRRRRSGLAAA